MSQARRVPARLVVVLAVLGLGHAALPQVQGHLEPARGVVAEQPPAGFMLGVLRRDGILVPFAAFDGRRWSKPWPEPVTNPVAPITLAGVPRRWTRNADPAGPWMVLPLAAGSGTPERVERRALDVLAPVVFEAHCEMNVGLQTTHVAADRVPPPHVHPYPKDGLAAMGTVRLEPIEIVPRDSPLHEALRASAVLASWFNEEEQRNIDAFRATGWTHPIGQAERASHPLTMEALHRVAIGEGLVLTYFEATRRYKWPAERDRGCDLVTLAQGWFVQAPSGPIGHRVSARAYDCEMRGAEFQLPLGVIRIDQKVFLVVQWSSWNAESYSVIEAQEHGIRTVLTTFGGGCPSGRGTS